MLFLSRPTPADTDDLAHVWFRTAEGVQGEFRSSRVTPAHDDNGFMEVAGDQGAHYNPRVASSWSPTPGGDR